MDTISNMLIKIKNAVMAGHSVVEIPFSKMKLEIVKLLKREGFIESFQKKGKGIGKKIEIVLRPVLEDGGISNFKRIENIKRVSKPGRRIYRGYKDIFPVKQGYGIAIISTSKGLRTDKKARQEKIGGEVLAKIW